MLITSNVHTHTNFCDGKCSIEEMVIGAINKGFDTLGISPHAHAPFDKKTTGLLKPQEFSCEIERLRAKYSGKIDILKGIELDYFGEKTIDTDYVIGSVHYIFENGEYFCFDSGRDNALAYIDKRFKSDRYEFARLYYSLVSEMVKKLQPDIIGHFDVLTKFNANNRILDEDSPNYRNIALGCAEEVLSVAPYSVFEVNTHAMYRGYKDVPYPNGFILKYICEHNGRIMLSSDSHNVESIGYKFDELISYVRSLGFKSVWQLKKNGFIETAI